MPILLTYLLTDLLTDLLTYSKLLTFWPHLMPILGPQVASIVKPPTPGTSEVSPG